MEEVQTKFQDELDALKLLEKEYQKAISQRTKLDGQLHENTGVKEEMDLLKGDGEVYKLIGPVLVKQELVEAKQNVAKRMDFITYELKRVDENISKIEKKLEQQRTKVSMLQDRFEKEQEKAAAIKA